MTPQQTENTMIAIDFHTHAFPDGLAKRAMESLQKNCPFKAVGDGTIAGLLKAMDAADVDVSVICTIATKVGQVEGIVKWCEEIRTDRIDPLPSVHPDEPDAVKWIHRFANDGFVGIKLHPMYQDFAFDDPRLDPIWDALSKTGLLIASHCGRDIAFPEDDDRGSPKRIRSVIERFPNLRLVCTHMGGWRSWDLAEQYLVGQNVYLETSFSLTELSPERATDIIRRHNPKHVLFGTDWPWNLPTKEVELLNRLGLSDAEKNAILYNNAAKLLGY